MFDHGILTLQRARIGGTAVPAFTIYNVEAVRAVCLAAEQSGSPVILQVGSSSYRQTSLRMMAAAAMAAAEEASVPVGVHLDHSVDVDEARMCIDLGYSSVMIDGSHLSFEDNVAITKSVVEIAHDAGVWVEGELGAVAGDEDESTGAQAAPSTDPAQAAEFAERTGVDALAIAIGTVHGFSDVPPDLDLGTLRDVARRVPIPLVLHGASG